MESIVHPPLTANVTGEKTADQSPSTVVTAMSLRSGDVTEGHLGE